MLYSMKHFDNNEKETTINHNPLTKRDNLSQYIKSVHCANNASKGGIPWNFFEVPWNSMEFNGTW